MNKRTIVALSDFGNTGISESIRHTLKHWHNQGHEIWHLALGYNGWLAAVDKESYPWAERMLPVVGAHYPEAKFGQACLAEVAKMAGADVVLTAFDASMVRYLAFPEQDQVVRSTSGAIETLHRESRSFQHIAYFPLDGLCSDGSLPRGFSEMISGFDIPVTYSDFAKQGILKDTGLDIPVIPIPHDPHIYRKIPRVAACEEIGFPEDRFIIGMVATNQYRKLWGEFIEAASRVAKRHKDVVILPWTTWDEQIMGGCDIADLLWRHGVHDRVINPGRAVQRFTDHKMAALYNAIDVLVLTTVGEGAGLPPLRARACGTPALVSNNSACTEFAAHPFELISSKQTHLDNGCSIMRYSTDIDELEYRLEKLYEDRDLRAEISEAGIAKSREWEIDKIMPRWDSLLERVG